MIIRGAPKDLNSYIAVKSYISNKLHQNGYNPKYIHEQYIYYQKNPDILEFMHKNNLDYF